MKKIFILEDTQDISEILDMFLTAEGYHVETFENIKNFNVRNQDISPDLYLLDVMLPDGSGLDICNEIKNGNEHKIPVVMMSANARIDIMRNECNPDEFIAKPFDLNDLAERIKTLIQ